MDNTTYGFRNQPFGSVVLRRWPFNSRKRRNRPRYGEEPLIARAHLKLFQNVMLKKKKKKKKNPFVHARRFSFFSSCIFQKKKQQNIPKISNFEHLNRNAGAVRRGVGQQTTAWFFD
jgi:hypothetical protein